MPKFPIVYGAAGGVLLAFLFIKFILPDSNLLLLLGTFMLAMGTLVALFEMKDISTCPTGDKNESVTNQPQQANGQGESAFRLSPK